MAIEDRDANRGRARAAGGVLALAAALVALPACAAPSPNAGRSASGSPGHAPVPEPIRRAVADPARPQADRARDPDRKPGKVLAFFGIAPGMKVADMMAGTGYYTEILSRLVGPEGTVYAQNTPFVLDRFAAGPLGARLARPGFDNVVRLDTELEDPGLPEAALDAVLIIRFYHDLYWQGTDRRAFNHAVYRALKPGGVYGIVDHRAPAGSGFQHASDLHRIDADLVMKEILASGFEFDAESDVLANPDDTHDWSIFADDGARRDWTDRFVYRFRKPS